MKKPRKLTVTSSRHDDNLYPLLDGQPDASARLAHSQEWSERLITYHERDYMYAINLLEICGHRFYCGRALCQECGVAAQRFFAELVEKKWNAKVKLKACTVTLSDPQRGYACLDELSGLGDLKELVSLLPQKLDELKLGHVETLGFAEVCLIRREKSEYWAVLHHFFAEETGADEIVAKLNNTLPETRDFPNAAWNVEVDDRRRHAYRMAQPFPPRIIEIGKPKLVRNVEPMKQRHYIEALEWFALFKTTDRMFGHGNVPVETESYVVE
jgi:hypothetical protein